MWRRTKSVNAYSSGEKNTVISSQLEKLISKPLTPIEGEFTSKHLTPIYSPTKRAQSISPVRTKHTSPYTPTRDKQNRKLRSQTGPPSLPPTRDPGVIEVSTSGPLPFRTQSDLPHLAQALTQAPPNPPVTQVQSISSSSGILSSGSIFSAYGDSTSSVATSGSEQVPPAHSDLDQAIHQHGTRSPQPRPTNLSISSSRKSPISRIPSPHRTFHPDLTPKSPHKLHMFWGQPGTISYNERFARPITETVGGFADPSLVTVPTECVEDIQVDSPVKCVEPYNTKGSTQLRQTPSVDSLASSTVNVITSITEEMQDLIGTSASSATSVGNKSDSSPEIGLTHGKKIIPNNQSLGSINRMMETRYSYLEDDKQAANSGSSSPITPQNNKNIQDLSPARSRAFSTPVERIATSQRMQQNLSLIHDDFNKELFLHTSNIIPVPTLSAPSPLIPPAHKFPLRRLHSLTNKNETPNIADTSELKPRRHLEGLVEADSSFDFSENLTMMGSAKQNRASIDFSSRKLVRKSSSFSSISSEIQLDESLNSDFTIPQLMSERRERSFEQLDLLDSPTGKNIAAKTELKKYVVLNLFDTEMSYVRSLETIIKENRERLTMQIQLHSPTLQNTLESLLFHLTHMLKKHKSFLVRIENAYKNYNQTTTIGGIIWHHFSQPDLLDTYLNYIQCYQALIDTLRYAATKTSNRQKKSPNPKDPFEKLTLADLLIQPIQRPSRYPLIIKDLQKQSIPGSSEYQQLANAMLEVGNFTKKMNACLQTDIPSGPEVLKELELMIDGLENLIKPNRLLLRQGGDFITETKPPMYYMNPRRDKCIFLFSDLILLCSSRPKSGTLVRASSFSSGDSTLDLAKRKLKLIWETPLQRVAIETNESIVEREKTKADKQVEKLLEDERRLTQMLSQMQGLHYGNNSLEKVITESLNQLHTQIYEKRLKLPSYNACLTLIDLYLGEKRIVVFVDEQTKLDWVKAYKEARGKLECEQQELSWLFERKDLANFPQFVKPLMLMESRSGMEATCACQVQTTSEVSNFWVCRSDKFGGQVVELSSNKGALPIVNASYTVSPSPILCITSVPDLNAEFTSDNEGAQEFNLSPLRKEEEKRPRSYSSRTFSERKHTHSRHVRHSSGLNPSSEILTDGHNLSKCSSASNLSEHSSNREYNVTDLDQFESIQSIQSQWNNSPLYVETCRGVGDLISMVSGSANSLTSNSDYEPSLLSLLGECGKYNKKYVTRPIQDSMVASSKEDSIHLSPLMERTNEELNTDSGKNSTILPESDSSRSDTITGSSTAAEIGNRNNPEVTDLDNYVVDPNQLNNSPHNRVHNLLNRFSPEKKPPEIENMNETPLLNSITGEKHSLTTNSKTKFPTSDDTSLPGISPDITHHRGNSRDLNRLWLQSTFNKSNPQLLPLERIEKVDLELAKQSDNDYTVSMPSTPTINDKMENVTQIDGEKKSKLEKRTSFTKLQIPKIFAHKSHRTSPKTSLKHLDEDTGRTTSPSANRLTPCSDTNLSRNGSQDFLSTSSKDSFHINGPTVWLGTESGGLIVFRSDANIRTQSRHTVQLSHSVHAICYHRSKVFVGIGNGSLIIFSYTKASQEWVQAEKRQVSNIDHPLLCISSIQQETLWVAEANRVHIFAGDVFKFPVKKFSLWPKQRNNSLIVINQIVYDGKEGVWVCLDREPTLHLYSTLTYTQILQLDCMGPCLQLIQDKILYKHMSDQFRITSVHTTSQGTWVGISSGILAFITSSKYDARACQAIEQPDIYPSFHGHTAGVKFIVPWKHRILGSKTDEIVVTGGIGYEFRGESKYSVEFEKDSHNSGTVLIWSPQ